MMSEDRVAANDCRDDCGAEMQPPEDEESAATPPAEMSDEEID
jgi:hypothetical protein